MNAYFTADGDAFVPTPNAKGPWGDTINGMYVGGILAHAIARVIDDADLQPTRLTVDLLSPVAMMPLHVQTTVVRRGKRLRLVDAEIRQAGRIAARASALFLRRGAQPADQIWSTPVAMPPLPPDSNPPFRGRMLFWAIGEDTEVLAPSLGLRSWEYGGPKYAWVREIGDLVDGAALTPFTRVAMAGDVASSLTHTGTGGLKFINADYTLTLSRLPEGPHIGLAALTHCSHAGVATGTATVVDALGPIGSAVATALVNPGFAPPSLG